MIGNRRIMTLPSSYHVNKTQSRTRQWKDLGCYHFLVQHYQLIKSTLQIRACAIERGTDECEVTQGSHLPGGAAALEGLLEST